MDYGRKIQKIWFILIRNRVAGIMVGINTVLKDDPSLNTRIDGQKGIDSVRIIVDSRRSYSTRSESA